MASATIAVFNPYINVVMSAFDIFQTSTATMSKLDKDGYGDLSVNTSFTVDIDPVFGYTQAFDKDGEQVEGKSTVISPNSSIDLSHKQWRLTINGKDYDVADIVPVYDIGTNNISHYEVMLR